MFSPLACVAGLPDITATLRVIARELFLSSLSPIRVVTARSGYFCVGTSVSRFLASALSP